MKIKRLLASIALVFSSIIALTSCSISGKPSYSNRVTKEEFSEKLEEYSLDMLSFFTKDFEVTASSSSKLTYKATELETKIKSKRSSYEIDKASMKYDKANNSLAVTSSSNMKSSENDGKSSNSNTHSTKIDMKIENNSTNVRMIDNLKKTYKENTSSFDDLLEDYIGDYLQFDSLSNCRYYIDGDKYTMVYEEGEISSTNTEKTLAITQYIIKEDKIVINMYEESEESVYSDEISSEKKSSTKASVVIKHKDIELKKLDVSDYTLVE